MTPLPAFRGLPVPALATPRALADWLQLTMADLEWLADAGGRLAREPAGPLQHYTFIFVPKKAGPPRLIEAPKSHLKIIQRQILRGILDHVQPHPAAHGFRAGHSCITAAQRHAGEDVLLVMDLKDFFLRTRLEKVHGLFRSLGYPWPVARLLTGLTSSAVPAGVFNALPLAQRHDWATRKLFQQPHLPQGAPTSPALANLGAWRLDCRLAALAGSLDAAYTRYSDDMAFSGGPDLADRIESFRRSVSMLASEEGFCVNPSKTRVMRQGQTQRITGLVVNSHVNVPREAYDRLKAILHNCARFGPDSQNRDGHADFRAHLAGRIGWVESANVAKGSRLRSVFKSIAWT